MVIANFRFNAHTVPKMLILAGILGWVLCGFTHVEVFCNNWLWLLLLGLIIWVIIILSKRK